MKKIITLLFLALFASCAFAGTALDGGFFTVQVADSAEWTVNKKTETQAVIAATDNTLSMAVGLLPATQNLKETAYQLAQAQNGTGSFREVEREGGRETAYEFDGDSGSPVYVQVFPVKKIRYGVISLIGDCKSQRAVDLFNSVNFK